MRQTYSSRAEIVNVQFEFLLLGCADAYDEMMSRRPVRKSHPAKAASGITRGRLLLLLCQGQHTVGDLSAALGVSGNAVRAQLDRLTAAGLVRQAGSRPGTRRPHAEFELTELGAELFPKAYEPTLRFLVDAMVERLPWATSRDLLLESGRRLLATVADFDGGRDARRWFEVAFERFGGTAAGIELLERPDRMVIRSCTCPLATLTRAHPRLCGVVAELLAEASGAPVHEQCTRGDSPRCSFEVFTASP